LMRWNMSGGGRSGGRNEAPWQRHSRQTDPLN
jgi:hypothetical protein